MFYVLFLVESRGRLLVYPIIEVFARYLCIALPTLNIVVQSILHNSIPWVYAAQNAMSMLILIIIESS